MRIKGQYDNSEGYTVSYVTEYASVKGHYLMRVNGLCVPRKRHESSRVIYSSDYLVTDLELYSAFCKLSPESSDHEIYFAYLDARHEVYTYH